ncbi:unnamed protein product [Ranitomeya imitator]|uniref:Uncharacterized protein n=1 Tax=Ranitomeya imitator TaxID=111125 RepID=A0ABN9MDR9_9NEOB|nr:unnamed protein product [Ranitomeya imitator]
MQMYSRHLASSEWLTILGGFLAPASSSSPSLPLII